MFSAYVYTSSMNPKQNPCDNFFEYACGGWTKKYTVPAGLTSFDTLTLLRDELTDKLKGTGRTFEGPARLG